MSRRPKNQHQQLTAPQSTTTSLDALLNKAKRLLEQRQYSATAELLQVGLKQYKTAVDVQKKYAELNYLYGCALQQQGQSINAITQFKEVLTLEPEHNMARRQLISLLMASGQHREALSAVEISTKQTPNALHSLEQKATILSALHRYDESAEIWEQLITQRHDIANFWSNAGNTWQSLGQLDKAINYYKKALACSDSTSINFSNLLTTLHYHPDYSALDIFNTTNEWQQRYAKNRTSYTHYQNKLQKNKKIRIGLLSDGFRTHPVGQMITSALEQLPNHELELYLYSTNNSEDIITHKLKNITHKWLSITHLDDLAFSEQIRVDGIDILFDLCGHNSGSRMPTMLMKPAPIQVKWVGGLINTTGVATIDYLLSDHIETPEEVDNLYVEKLIRMPDDYICYNPPLYTPDITPLPASYNNHITLGCFNNPTKINAVLLEQWAKALHSLPNAQLFLKGLQFGSKLLQNNVRQTLAEHGINEARVIIEGPSGHSELLRTYNKIDIALDPWPYSGGLTTCEALFMGVPVVTLPGPTFAGRHSATHLTNVGLGQLVAEDWQHYHDIVVNLASDLDNLANIRTHLRTALLESPVCDAPRFARNFSNAMRAIWQRHCEGKKPAALSLDKDGNAQFADEVQPVELQLPEEPITVADNDEFRFQFKGKVITLDNGASLTASNKFAGLQRLGALDVLCLDAASRVTNSQQLSHVGNFHYFPMTVLGDGSTVPLYVTVDPALTSTLKAIVPEEPSFFKTCQQSPEIMTELPIQTIALDTLQAIEKLDWLVLDRMHNPLTIIEHGRQKLTSALVIQVSINLQPLYQEQANFSQLSQRLSELGFRFLTLSHLGNQSHFANRKDILAESASELPYVDAIFIPNDQCLLKMDNNSKTKLAFLLHSAYQLKDISYQLLASIDSAQAENYLLGENLISSQGASNHAVADTESEKLTNKPETTFALPSAPAMTEAERQLFAKHCKRP